MLSRKKDEIFWLFDLKFWQHFPIIPLEKDVKGKPIEMWGRKAMGLK
jgi:hypothetical protein